jgi:hypothetical protein
MQNNHIRTTHLTANPITPKPTWELAVGKPKTTETRTEQAEGEEMTKTNTTSTRRTEAMTTGKTKTGAKAVQKGIPPNPDDTSGL